jgi:hypothetical protein
MMRENIGQLDLKPRVYLIDENEEQIKPLFLDIEPAEDVFEIELAKKIEDSKFAEELDELVSAFKDKKKRPDFRQTIDLIIKKQECSKSLINKINSIWEKAII